jgi:hemerythrin-like metal-binding protein
MHARMINMVYFVGMAMALAVLISRIIMGSAVFLIIVLLLINLLIVVLFVLCNRFWLHSICTWISLIVFCDVLLPLSYFGLGGIESAITGYYVLGMVLLFLFSPGKKRIILLTTHILLVIFCYYLSSLPSIAEKIPKLDGFDRYLDHIQTFVSVGIGIGLIVVFQRKLYESEKHNTERAQKAIFYRDKLLHVVNDVAEMSLSTDIKQIDLILQNAMETMARCIDVDHIYLWKQQVSGGKIQYRREYEWFNDTNAEREQSSGLFFPNIPDWELLFAEGRCINAALSEFSSQEQELFKSYKLKSLLVIPLFVLDQLWGYISFFDCRRERIFSNDEVNILRSGGMMLINTIARYNNDIALGNRLKQQELMSDISQSFISKEPTAVLIADALRRMGEFLKPTRIVIAVPDMTTCESYPVYSWFSEEKWRPSPVQSGFNEILSNTFPKYVYDKGIVSSIRCDNIFTDGEGKYKIFEAVDVKSFIWTPLYVDGIFWGILSVEECVNFRHWNESDAQLVRTVSSAVSGAVARDIMEKGRAEALEEAVRASHAKSEFLSNMSHEMRTPMNAIIGMTAIGKTAPNIDRKNYCLEKIEDASNHLLGVINDILDMSKIEANKLELSLVGFDFEKTLQQVVNVINFRIEERRQSFYVNLDKKIPHSLEGDDQRLAQVITNLLSNAVKFTPKNGTIRLNADLLEEKDEVCVLQIEVRDTGIGISQEQQDRLFSSFEQAEVSTTRKFGGTGLGLAISRRIVEMMGGKIWVKSELGQGASFFFTVRMKRLPEERHGSLLKPGVNWSNMRVLAVDDDPEIRQYFAEIARRFDITCDVAEGGEEALQLIEKKGGYDIYFIDWKMPGMNGMELSRRIKDQHKERSVVTMISAVEWNSIEAEARNAGVDHFLPKPLFPSAIADLINECIGRYDPEDLKKTSESRSDSFEDRCLLLAEDVEINREIVLALLEPTKLSIECAANGAEAVRMFSEDPKKYDMIFMDVQMPEMDGYEATRRIRAIEKDQNLKGVPIVAMTANVFKEDVEKALAAGMNDHIGKPLDFDDVLVKLRTYLPVRAIKFGRTDSGDSESWKQSITWGPELATGNKDIDSHHKQLFRLLNNLAAACTNGQETASFKESLDFFVSYSDRHMREEEALQRSVQYPGYEEHKKLHERLKETVADSIARFTASGSASELLEIINSVIIRDMVRHIEKEDSKIADYIREKNRGGSELS